VLKIIKNSSSPPVLTPMPPKNCWSFIKTVNAFDSYFETIPQTLQTLKNKVKKGEPNYDPTTLYIPPNEWKEFTPGMY